LDSYSLWKYQTDERFASRWLGRNGSSKRQLFT
ncbi:Ribosomal large subunit pseudouridine synthase B, partial [Haemophilus influenzae]